MTIEDKIYKEKLKSYIYETFNRLGWSSVNVKKIELINEVLYFEDNGNPSGKLKYLCIKSSGKWRWNTEKDEHIEFGKNGNIGKKLKHLYNLSYEFLKENNNELRL